MAQMSKKEYLANIQDGLVAELAKNKEALPPGFNKDRFILNSITVIQDMLKDKKKSENLGKVNIETIPLCLAKGAYLGLDFFNGECYAIPYGGNMQFQTDYKGEIKLCKRYSQNPIKDIFAKVVREGDFFEEEVNGGVQNIHYKPVPFSDSRMVGAFAVVVYKDGSMLYDTMSAKDIETVRDVYSKAKDSQAWKESPGEMYKKTVLRRLCKLIDLNFDNIAQRLAYEDGGDAVFWNQQIPAGVQPALPDNGEPLDVFDTAGREMSRRKEPVPVQAPEDAEEEFRRFEQMYQDHMAGFNPDDIPDGELPFA